MSSTALSQDPLLVWPAALLGQSRHFIRSANATSQVVLPSFEPERRDEIQSLITAMERDFPHMPRAINWYKSLLERTPENSREQCADLSFLRNIEDDAPNPHDFQLGARPPTLDPHVLKVVFHRREL